MRILCIGAHPDDCEIGFGGTAAKLADLGHSVKFLAMTNGDAGHHIHPAEKIAAIRKHEAEEGAARLGIAEGEVLPNRDGELLPTLDARREAIRQIRRWQADMVLTHRPWDYHPDHRYTSQIVQDSAYLVGVPRICPETPALYRNPLFLYMEDGFHRPAPFTPEIAVDIDGAWCRKLDALDAHASQVYEWLPWIEGTTVPDAARKDWLSRNWTRPIGECTRAALARRYGMERARQIRHAEAFEICEYGRRPSPEELDEIFEHV